MCENKDSSFIEYVHSIEYDEPNNKDIIQWKRYVKENGCKVLSDPKTNKDWCSHDRVPEYCPCMCDRTSEPIVPVVPVERN